IPAVWTEVGAHRERLGAAFPAAGPLRQHVGTIRRGSRWGDRLHALAGARCLARADRQAMAPPGVLHALGATGFAAGPMVCGRAVLVRLGRGTATQVGRPERCAVDGVVFADQGERRLVGESAPLAADLLLLLGTPAHRLGAAVRCPACGARRAAGP